MNNGEASSVESEFALRYYVGVLWRRRLIIIAVAMIGLAVGLFVGRGGSKTHASTVQILFQPRAAEQIFAPTDEADSASRADPVSTEIAVMQSRSVRDPVVDEIGQPIRISIAPIEGTQVVALTASAPRRERAQLVAQTYAETYIAIRLDQLVSDLLKAIETVQTEVTAINTQLAELDGPLREVDDKLLTAVDENARRTLENEREDLLAQRQPLLTRKAAFEEEIDKLRLARNLTATGGAQIVSDATPARLGGGGAKREAAAGLALGLVFGVVLAFVREHFDETVKNLAGFESNLASTPVLALIPRVRRRWWRRGTRTALAARSEPASPAADAYRALWASVELVSASDASAAPVRSVHITSPGPEDGRTITTANLAVLIARSGRRVMLVDADTRRPALHRYLGAQNAVGLTSVVDGTTEIQSALQQIDGEPGLRLLAAGPPDVGARAQLSPGRVRQLLAELAADADVVLVDGPPLLFGGDSVMYATAVDAALLLARVRHTREPEIARAAELLRNVRAPLVGAALSGVGRREGARAARWAPQLTALLARFGHRRNGRSRLRPRSAMEESVNGRVPVDSDEPARSETSSGAGSPP